MEMRMWWKAITLRCPEHRLSISHQQIGNRKKRTHITCSDEERMKRIAMGSHRWESMLRPLFKCYSKIREQGVMELTGFPWTSSSLIPLSRSFD